MTLPLITRTAAEADLFGTRDGTCLFAPIRHHSPACAWMLRAMIRDHRPDFILIEAPSDLSAHIPHLTDPETRAPVAIVALGPDGPAGRGETYVPFSDTSPELIALREAARIGAEVRFIDLPTGHRTGGKLSCNPKIRSTARPSSPPAARALGCVMAASFGIICSKCVLAKTIGAGSLPMFTPIACRSAKPPPGP